MNKIKKINKILGRRKERVRAKIREDLKKPRISVFKSNKNVYIQVIDDQAQKTIVSASLDGKKSKEKLEELGKKVAQELISKDIKEAVFDRGLYKYHGDVKIIVESARKNGLKI
jgi:large subunit ribosomal protein L18